MEKTPRILSLAIVLITFVIYCFFPAPAEWGLIRDHIWSRLYYLWFHGNILHWAINMYALTTLTFLCGIDNSRFFIGLLVAVCLPEFLLSFTPIVGLSGWLFFLSGSLAFRMSRSNRVRFVSNNLLVIFATSFLAHIAWALHLWCFALGIIYSFFESHKATGKRSA